MDFHDDHTSFDTASTDGVSEMYVPHAGDSGLGDDHTGGSDDHTGQSAGDDGDTTVTAHTGGHEVTADATIDIDHDGHNDTAIVEDAQGDRIAITDTDGDGEADHAALLDESGHVVDTAHLDSSGSWVQDAPGEHGPYGSTVGDGAAPDGGSSGSGSSDSGSSTGAGAAAGAGAGAGGHTIVIDSGGQHTNAQATVDTDHDGTADTAVVRTPDGNQVAFTDSDGDGHADQAVVYGQDGHLIGTAHYDESTGTWIEGSGADTSGGTSTAGAGGAAGLGASAGGDGSGDAGTNTGGNTGGIGTSPAGNTGTGTGDQIEVTVGGHTTEVAAGYDLNNDGHDETAIVQGPDGTRIAFSDTDGDGDADKAAVYDAAGKLVGTATYNEGSGTWVQDH